MGMKILCVFGKHNYGDPERGFGYEYTNFIPAFRRLGHDVVFFESFSRKAYKSFSDLNRQFLMAVEENKPDLIFCVLMGYELWTETLEMVRTATNAAIVNWATDDSWKYDQFSRFVAPCFHLYATTYHTAIKRSKEQGHSNFILTQWAANAEKLMKPLAADECRWKVSFVGSAYGNRTKWVSALKNRGIDVQCFGHGWPAGPVAAQSIPEIVSRSVISLNFADSSWMFDGLRPYRSRQIKARVFEVPGYGGFLLTENADNLDHFYRPGKEIELFEGIDELTEKIRFYLANPKTRDAIAHAGHLRTRQEHTYDKRFAALLHLVDDIKANHFEDIGPQGEGRGIDLERFSALARLHQPSAGLKALKQVLVAPCTLIFGRKKGPRAARRLLFELSWRLAGSKTYRASGWPGKLFYLES
jgi:spore maturation protein CgeB